MTQEPQVFPWFDTIPKAGTIWKYKRAIEGHKFLLIESAIDFERGDIQAHFQIYDGHTYSHWGAFPNIFDQSCIGMFQALNYSASNNIPLHLYECKEFTLSATNIDSDNTKRFCSLTWFYEVPMSKIELLEYAVKQPRYKYRHGGSRTLDRFED